MQNSNSPLRYLVIAVLIGGAFFGAYSFASARNAGGEASTNALNVGTGATQATVAAGSSDAAGSDSAAGGCACCGSTAPTEDGVTGDKAEAAAVVDGDVQKIEVDVSQGFYQPNIIKLKAGVPAEITFGKSAGCTAQVLSEELGFFEDLSAGPRTVRVDDPKAGEYAFSCGMQMVFGKVVVE